MRFEEAIYRYFILQLVLNWKLGENCRVSAWGSRRGGCGQLLSSRKEIGKKDRRLENVSAVNSYIYIGQWVGNAGLHSE